MAVNHVVGEEQRDFQSTAQGCVLELPKLGTAHRVENAAQLRCASRLQ